MDKIITAGFQILLTLKKEHINEHFYFLNKNAQWKSVQYVVHLLNTGKVLEVDLCLYVEYQTFCVANKK